MAVLGREAEDMGVVMWQFCAGRLRIWGVSCRSFVPGGSGYGSCYVAVLGREAEDMGVVWVTAMETFGGFQAFAPGICGGSVSSTRQRERKERKWAREG